MGKKLAILCLGLFACNSEVKAPASQDLAAETSSTDASPNSSSNKRRAKEVAATPSPSSSASPTPTPPPSPTPSPSERVVVDCSPKKREALLAKGLDKVKIDCNLTLQAGDVITHGLVLEGEKASGISIDCNGATLDVRDDKAARYAIDIHSVQKDGEWSVPEDIRIKGCKIFGSIRIYGMATNGQGTVLRDSSRKIGHTERAQAAAPRRIELSRLNFQASKDEGIPLYISPGTREVTIQNSRFEGELTSTAIYLDAESADNVIRNNVFRTKPEFREVIAVDGSARNLIVGNSFSGLGWGGIFLYRNCGEGGTVRHQTPHHNQIINNVFYYNKMDDDLSTWKEVVIDVFNFFSPVDLPEFANPAIWVASRNGNAGYCDEDKGYDFGSSANNNDLARNTIVLNNRIYKLDPKKMIRFHDYPNIASGNVSIESDADLGSDPTPVKRYSGCFVQKGFPNAYLNHGQTMQLFTDGASDLPVCTGRLLTCNDGELVASKITCPNTPPIQNKDRVDFFCSANGSNSGCSKTVSCPSGTKVVSAKAQCNLEYGTVSSDGLDEAAWGVLQVLKKSDDTSDGECRLGDLSISSLSRSVHSLRDSSSLGYGCKEKDKNGGDCQIRGRLICK